MQCYNKAYKPRKASTGMKQSHHYFPAEKLSLIDYFIAACLLLFFFSLLYMVISI